MRTKILITVLGIGLLSTNNVFNTAGRLSGGSIVTCNGQTYGSHSKDDPHYHVASKKESGYWYPNGGVVSKSNPCASSNTTSPSNTSTKPAGNTTNSPAGNVVNNAEAEKKKKQDAEILEKQRIEKEKLEKEKLEKERIENERIMAEQLKLELERLENIALKDVRYNDSKLRNVLHEFDYNHLNIVPENENATVEILKSDIKPFQMNTIEYVITSENQEKSKKYSYDFFMVGEVNKIEEAELVFISNASGNTPYVSNMNIKNKDLKNGFDKIQINDKELNITDYRYSDEKIYFNIEGKQFSLPYTAQTGSTFGALAITSIVGVTGVYSFKKLKKIKSETKE